MTKQSSESRIQQEFVMWLWNCHPQTRYLCYHIPNGGLRSAREAAALKAMGVVPGIPDIHIAIANGGYNSLYIEFKAPGASLNNQHVKQQHEVQERLRSANNKVCICYSLQEAKSILLEYLSGTKYINSVTQI